MAKPDHDGKAIHSYMPAFWILENNMGAKRYIEREALV